MDEEARKQFESVSAANELRAKTVSDLQSRAARRAAMMENERLQDRVLTDTLVNQVQSEAEMERYS